MTKYWAGIPSAYLDLNSWPAPIMESIPSDYREDYLFKRRAVYLYAQNATGKQIEKETHISHSYAIRLVKKCVKPHPDGKIQGFRALVKYSRVKKFTRRKKRDISTYYTQGGLAGAFTSLLNEYPILKEIIDDQVLRKKSQKIYESGISVKRIHQKFLKKCIELGLDEANRYPFNTEQLGYHSVIKYVREFIASRALVEVKASVSNDAIKKNKSTGMYNRRQLKPYDRVECDAHHIDSIFCVLIPTHYGEFVPIVLDRIWLIVIIEVETRCILGYHISLNKECKTGDVLKCIKHALGKWKKIEHIKELQSTYPPVSG